LPNPLKQFKIDVGCSEPDQLAIMISN